MMMMMIQEMRELRVSPETSAESCTFFVWPLDIVHVIGTVTIVGIIGIGFGIGYLSCYW